MALYSSQLLTKKQEWRVNALRADNTRSYTLAKGNGTTNFGLVKAGTILGLLTDGNDAGKVRPAACQDIGADASGVNVVTVPDAANFYVGDDVEITVSEASKARDTATLAAGDDPSDLIVTSVEYADTRIRVALVDPSANSQPLSLSIRDDGTNKDITVSLATDGTGAITSTTGDVAAILNGEAGHLVSATAETPADLAVAVAATALTGGRAVGDTVASGRTVTVRTATTVAFDGAAVTVAKGDVIYAGNGIVPVGVCESQVTTTSFATGVEVGVDQIVTVGIEGHAQRAKLIGLSEFAERMMLGGYVKPNISAEPIKSRFAGIQIHG